MDDFKARCLSFCILLAAVTVMRFVIPECKMKSVSDAFLSLIVIVAMFLPFTDRKAADASGFSFDMEEYSENFDERSQYEAALEKYIGDTLEKNGIKIEKTDVSAEVDGDGYIVIDGINITASPSEDAQKIKSVIRDECGLDEEKVTVN